MNEGFTWSLGFVLAAMLLLGAVVWHSFRPRTRKRAALLISSETRSILAPKASVLSQLLHRRMAMRGIAAVQADAAASDAAGMKTTDSETAMLASARALGADYGLVISLDDLNCQVDESRVRNVGEMRVNTTLCVAYRLFEIGPGRLLAGQTLAFCRRTPPIVRGTAVGSDVLDGLMREVADRIDQQLESLQLSA